jgi:rhamnosyltransferase
MFLSEQFKNFWHTMPPINGYEDSICFFEVIFTKDFESYGFTGDVYINTDDLKDFHEYPLMLYPLELIKSRRCPIFKRKTFFNLYEEFLDVSCGQSALELYNYLLECTDYDIGMIWRNLLRTGNMYDIKNRMQLNYVVSTLPLERKKSSLKTALLMHIYDMDMLDTCKYYANSMPDNADIYITTSSEKAVVVQEKFNDFGGRVVTVIPVENRGRDVSAFLLVLKKYAEQYDAVCFIHDKKSAYNKPFLNGESFAYKCYENVLGNPAFVQNILYVFEDNPYLGLLVPPPPNHGEYFYILGLEWQNDYLATKELAEKMRLNVPISDDKPPIAPIGSCFWFRPQAMKKIFEYPFKYEDFSPEPFQMQDGNLVHAIERIYPFVAQSSGYYTGWILSDKFAKMEITNLSKQLRDYNQTVFWNFGVQDRHALLHCISMAKNNQTMIFKYKELLKKMVGPRMYNLLRSIKNRFFC